VDNFYIETPQGNLDIKEGFGFGINISIAELLDVSKKNTPYTKTILLPGTKANNQILGSLFDVNADFTFFNPNFKIDAKIVVNSTTVINGYLQLLEVKKLNDNDLQGNNIQYSVKISDNVINFYTDIKDKELTDLDLSDFDHILTRTNIEGSWTNTFEDTYTYPLLFKQSNIYQTSDFKPAIFHKAYLLKIFEEAQYSVGGSFMNNTDYDKETIPFNREANVIDQTEVDRRKFFAGATGNTYPTIILTGGGAGGDINDIAPFTSLDDDSTPPFFDNAGVWNTTTNSYTADRNGTYELKGTIGFEIEWNSGGLDAYMYGYDFTDPALGEKFVQLNRPLNRYEVRMRMFKNGSKVLDYISPTLDFAKSTGVGLTFDAGNSWTVSQNAVVDINQTGLNLIAGDVITFDYRVFTFQFAKYTTSATLGAGSDVPVNFIVSVDNNNVTTSLFNTPLSGILTDDDSVVLNSFIPQDIKQSDLIDDIVKRYNLVIRTDKDNSKKLLIDTKDDYYDAGVSLDWTDKKDYSNEDSIKFLADLQNKEMILSYSQDDDIYNEKYTESIDGVEIYGQKKIEFDNQFVKGTQKIETKFSPTPLVYSSPNKEMVLPFISTVLEDVNIRVLYYGGLINCLGTANWSLDSVDSGVPTSTTYTTYPYAGHFDNPVTPTVDINFGSNSYHFYNELLNTTSNNLYNTYWINTIRQIAEGKLITSKFDLTEVDIAFIIFNLNAEIFVKDSYYRINKIIDYNPLEDGLTKVELVKIIEIKQIAEEDPFVDSNPNVDVISTETSLSGNISNSVNTVVAGSNNYIGFNSEGAIVTGENNTVGNEVENSSIVGGEGNVIESGLENVSVIASSDLTITKSNTTAVGGLIESEGTGAESLVIEVPTGIKANQNNLTGFN